MTTTDPRTELAQKRPAEIVHTHTEAVRTRQVAVLRSPLPDRGRWVLPFALLGLPILFVLMVAIGFATTR